MCYIERKGQQGAMDRSQKVVLQKQKPRFTPIPAKEPQESRLELFLRKVALAAITMLGIGYVLVNAPIAILVGHAAYAIPIASQANVSALTGRILFLIASSISVVLGVLFIFGAVQFYERGRVKGTAFLGVSLASFYLLCLGVGSVLLSEANLATMTLTVAPLIVFTSAALFVSSSPRSRLVGSLIGIAGSIALAYAIFNLQVLDLLFAWDIPFTGPLLSLTVLECAAVILVPVAATVHTVFNYASQERLVPRAFTLLVALVYGLGTLVGSIVLSMNLWNLIWKSPWTGPFYSLPEWGMNVIVFWSASLVLMDIGGILLIAVACLGFISVGRELSKL